MAKNNFVVNIIFKDDLNGDFSQINFWSSFDNFASYKVAQ